MLVKYNIASLCTELNMTPTETRHSSLRGALRRRNHTKGYARTHTALAPAGSQETCGVLHAETEGTGDVTHRTQDTANMPGGGLKGQHSGRLARKRKNMAKYLAEANGVAPFIPPTRLRKGPARKKGIR